MNSNRDLEEPVILAHQCYVKKDYIGALQYLNDLENLVGNSNKRIQHNRAVVEFMAGDMKDVEKFKNTITHLAGVTFPEIDIQELSSPCLYYNYAVLLYHSRHYYQCVVILDKLLSMKNIKDSKLMQKTILLLLEATISRRTYDKTLEIARTYGDTVKPSNKFNEIFERLVARAQLLMGQKIKLNLKVDTIENALIIAQQNYINGDLYDAIKTLESYKTLKCNYNIRTQGEDIWAAINNNIGVIYLAMKKPYIASKFFQIAIKEYFKGMKNVDSNRLIVCRDRPLYVYNLGIGLLATTNYVGSFECLVEAARHYPNNPKVWLHLAECCVKKCYNEDNQQYTVKKIGNGPHTRLLFAKENRERYSLAGESYAIPSLSLEFAALCLRNVMTLLPNQETPTDVTLPFIQVPPGPPINWKQRCELKNSALVLQSYVCLNLHDPLSALVSANDLLSQADVSNSHKAWAHIYAAEALINLDRIGDAVEHLNPPMINDLVSVLPYQMSDMIAVSVWAKAAVCHILRGDLVTARKILLQINSPRVLPLQMYLEICSGNIENCHTILRKLRFTNSS